MGLKYLHERDYKKIEGKFHAHLYVEAPKDGMEGLKRFCAMSVGTKLTVIDLFSFGGRKQKDVMVTKYYKIDGGNAVHNIIDDLDMTAKNIAELGYMVLRVKLEHESLPTLSNFGGDVYREVHIKLSIDKERYIESMDFLRANSARFGYVPSSNPAQMNATSIIQFINVRYYGGGLGAADDRTAELLEFVKNNKIRIVEVKRETAVFDTNLDLDKWWTCSVCELNEK